MNAQPLVSVIIPSYNSGEYITETINSILKQSYKNIEIIVVDDGSTDRTARILQNYIKNNNIKYILQENRGVSRARNTGIASSKGGIVALCDADDVWVENKLELQVPLFNNQDVALVYGGTEVFGDDIDIDMDHSKAFKRGGIFDDLMRGNFICTSSTLIRKEVIKKVGGFDEKLKFVEDLDLWLRITSKYKADFTPERVVKYRIHSGNTSSNYVQQYQVEVDVVKRACSRLNIPKQLAKKYLYFSYWRLSYFSAESKDYKVAIKALMSAIYLNPMKLENGRLFLKILLRR